MGLKPSKNNERKALFTTAENIVVNICHPLIKKKKKNILNPVTYIKDSTGYMLFKKADGTNVIYQVQKKDDHWIVMNKNSKQGKKMDYKIPWYI